MGVGIRVNGRDATCDAGCMRTARRMMESKQSKKKKRVGKKTSYRERGRKDHRVHLSCSAGLAGGDGS